MGVEKLAQFLVSSWSERPGSIAAPRAPRENPDAARVILVGKTRLHCGGAAMLNPAILPDMSSWSERPGSIAASSSLCLRTSGPTSHPGRKDQAPLRHESPVAGRVGRGDVILVGKTRLHCGPKENAMTVSLDKVILVGKTRLHCGNHAQVWT